MKRWDKKPLAEVADFCLGKMLDQKKNKGTYRPYLANVNVRWGEFNMDNLRQMPFESHELERYGLKYGDIVMCEGGEPGRCAIWKDHQPGMMIQKALHRIRPHKCLDYQFLYYSFLNIGRKGAFSPLFTGSTIKHLPRQNLANLIVQFPILSIQGRIASVLSSYDNLIENNRRRIRLLEESARLLYREWFVHLRFPGHERVKVVDGLPAGWERKMLINKARITMGQSPKSEFYNDVGDGLPFHQGVTNYGNRFVAHKFYSSKITRLAEVGDILCSVRAPVGRLNYTRDRIILGRGLCAITSLTNNQSFLYYQLNNFFFKEDIIGSGSIYAAVTKKDMEGIELITPPSVLIKIFEEISVPVDMQIENLCQQNIQLAQARDILLPRLMNGEIEV